MITELLRKVHDRDIQWSEQHLLRTPFYPAFWVHRRIEQAIASQTHLARGFLLDLGCGKKPYEKLFESRLERYFGMDYSPTSGYRRNTADVCGDASAIPLASSSVDTVVCTEVLEHVQDPDAVIGEIARVLKPGGVVLCTAPFVYPVHDTYDFFRYSAAGMETLMIRHGLQVQKIVPLSGTGLTLAIMLNLYWFEMGFMWTKWLYPLGLILRPLLLLLSLTVNVSGWVLERILPSSHMPFNYLTVASRPS
jgi:SAM-dependent methyltransferase